jgi:hypothetical protein
MSSLNEQTKGHKYDFQLVAKKAKKVFSTFDFK